MFRNMHFDFIGKRKIFFTFSVCLIILIGALSFILGVKMDIQFKGGTIITYTCNSKVDSAELQKLVQDTIKTNVSVTEKAGINGQDSIDISLTEAKGLNADSQLTLTNVIQEKYGDKLELLASSSVDPIIGKEFFYKSMVAVAFAALVLIVYIGFRFKKISGWSAGVMAVLALLHDCIVVFGVFVIFRMPLDYNFIAVILTILGYSINDTIVIYDRIRENKKINKTMPVDELVNKSINETMARTINTTVSTMISMIVITIVALVSGVNSILSFSFPLLIGLVSGTYSTVFIAGPLWVEWQKYKVKKQKQASHAANLAKKEAKAK